MKRALFLISFLVGVHTYAVQQSAHDLDTPEARARREVFVRRFFNPGHLPSDAIVSHATFGEFLLSIKNQIPQGETQTYGQLYESMSKGDKDLIIEAFNMAKGQDNDEDNDEDEDSDEDNDEEESSIEDIADEYLSLIDDLVSNPMLSCFFNDTLQSFLSRHTAQATDINFLDIERLLGSANSLSQEKKLRLDNIYLNFNKRIFQLLLPKYREKINSDDTSGHLYIQSFLKSCPVERASISIDEMLALDVEGILDQAFREKKERERAQQVNAAQGRRISRRIYNPNDTEASERRKVFDDLLLTLDDSSIKDYKSFSDYVDTIANNKPKNKRTYTFAHYWRQLASDDINFLEDSFQQALLRAQKKRKNQEDHYGSDGQSRAVARR